MRLLRSSVNIFEMSDSRDKFDSDVIEKWNLIKNESGKVHGVIEVDTVKLPDWIDRERYVNVCLPVFAKIRPRLVVSQLRETLHKLYRSCKVSYSYLK